MGIIAILRHCFSDNQFVFAIYRDLRVIVGDFLIQIRQLLVELVLGVNPGFVGIGFEKATVHGHFFAPKQRQLFAQ